MAEVMELHESGAIPEPNTAPSSPKPGKFKLTRWQWTPETAKQANLLAQEARSRNKAKAEALAQEGSDLVKVAQEQMNNLRRKLLLCSDPDKIEKLTETLLKLMNWLKSHNKPALPAPGPSQAKQGPVQPIL